MTDWTIRPARRVLTALTGSVWAIEPGKLEEILAFVDRYSAGVRMSREDFAAAVGPRPAEQAFEVHDGVAIVPLQGTISYRANLLTNFSGGTSAEKFAATLERLADDPDVSAIVIHADTPGGTAEGLVETGNRIFALREKKPIVAVADPWMASAGYWLGSQATELVVSDSGSVGSIGVYTVHTDYSKADEAAGFTRTIIRAGRLKAAGNSYEPLDDEARALIQEDVDEIYRAFVDAVARGRSVSAKVVRDTFGEGKMINAKKAVSLGMADRVATLRETVSRLQSSRARKSLQRRALAAKMLTYDLQFPAADSRDKEYDL